MKQNKNEKISDMIEELLNSYPSVFTMTFWRAIELHRLSKYLQYLNGDIVDIGCGDGLFATLLFGPNRIAVGYDIDNKILSTKLKTAYRKVIVADTRSNPFPNGRFDSLFSNCAIEHFPDINQSFHEFHRISKLGSFFLFTVVSGFFYYDFWIAKLSRFGLRKLSDIWIRRHAQLRQHPNVWDITEWERFLKEHGFTPVIYEYYFNSKTMFWWSLLEDAYTWPFKIGFLIRVITKLSIPKRVIHFLVRRLVTKDEYLCNKFRRGAGLLILAQRDTAGIKKNENSCVP